MYLYVFKILEFSNINVIVNFCWCIFNNMDRNLLLVFCVIDLKCFYSFLI